MLEIGSLVDGKYRILQKIGQGGMSIVYLARNERANKQWAIKEVRKDGVHDYEVVKQGLVAEIDMLKRLNHPHLPSIIDVIDGVDSFLIVMDYVEGNPLDKAIEATGAQTQDNVVDWAKQLCDVLGYLHSRKPPIIYRDMKPANVMLKPDGSVVLIDFGTAREYKNQSVADTTCLGTRGYAAPEQFGGMGQTDARTDIYCLGATIYHLVTGHNPCTYPYEMKPIREWNPQLSSGLESIILKCTQSNPDDRYQSCEELYYDLEHYKDLDIENMRKYNVKWRLFLVCCIMFLVMTAGAVASAILKNNVSKSTYDNYIHQGETAADPEEKIQNYKEAVNLDPTKSDAYLSILEIMTESDNVFKDDEYYALRSEVLEHSNTDFSNKTNISILKEKNPDGYAKFASELGYACYFECEDIDNSNTVANARTWFKEAVETGDLNTTDKARAEMIIKLVENRDGVKRKKKDGTSATTYKSYWESVRDILADSSSVSTLMQMEMSRYALKEVITHSGDFLNDGVEADEIQSEVITKTEELCAELEKKGKVNDNTIAPIYDEIKNSKYGEPLLKQASDALENAKLMKQKREENFRGSQSGQEVAQ